MSILLTGNVARHLAWQVGAAFVTAGVAALMHVDYSSLGAWAPIAQMCAALAGAIVNEALGSAPKS